jgi:ketosteroid isomerase-like protein
VTSQYERYAAAAVLAQIGQVIFSQPARINVRIPRALADRTPGREDVLVDLEAWYIGSAFDAAEDAGLLADPATSHSPGSPRQTSEEQEGSRQMSDFQAIADRVEIQALLGEFTDAVTMCDYDRVASLFTPDGAVRMPHANVDLVGPKEISAFGQQRDSFVEYLVQNTSLGTTEIHGDTASGRAYLNELIKLRDGSSHLNYGIYHDRYQRTPEGWKFTERVYEIRYLDTTPLTGAPPNH